MRLARAVDLWMGELARAGREASTRNSYSRYLNKLIDHLERTKPDPTAREVTVNDCRAFLDSWIDKLAVDVAPIHSALNGLFAWLYLEGEIEANPMVRIKRPRRPRPEDVDGRDVTRAEVERMLAGDGGLAGVPLPLGARLHGHAAGLREPAALEGRRPGRGHDSLSERRAASTPMKPMPYELSAILRAAVESGEVAAGPNDYVIPNRRPATVRRAERPTR